MKSNLRVQMGCRPLCLLLEWHAIYQPQKGGLRNETFGGWVTEGNDWRAMNELVIFSYRIGRKPRHGWQWSPSRLQPVGWTVTSSKKVTFPRPWAENKSWRITRYTETFPRRQGHSYCGGSWSHTAAVSCPICNIRRAACEPNIKSEFGRHRHPPGSSVHETEYLRQHYPSRAPESPILEVSVAEPCLHCQSLAQQQKWGNRGFKDALLGLQQHHALERSLLLCCKGTTAPKLGTWNAVLHHSGGLSGVPWHASLIPPYNSEES